MTPVKKNTEKKTTKKATATKTTAKKATETKAVEKKASEKKAVATKTAVKKTAVKKAAVKKTAVKKAVTKKSPATTKPVPETTTGTPELSATVAEQTAPEVAKPVTAAPTPPAVPEPPVKPVRTAEEQEELREVLAERISELEAEHRHAVESMEEAQRLRLADSAGDDQADSGSKTVEHEQELTIVRTLAEKIIQAERSMERLKDGDYGICEKCGKPIPALRLAVFPSATLCVSCKQLEERR